MANVNDPYPHQPAFQSENAADYLRGVNPGDPYAPTPGASASLLDWALAKSISQRRAEENRARNMHAPTNPLINGAPGPLKKWLKQVQATGMGGEINELLMASPEIQGMMQKQWGGNLPAAMRQMDSMAFSFGAIGGQQPINPMSAMGYGSMVNRHLSALAAAGGFQKAYLDQMLSGPNNSVNMGFTGGMGAAPAMRLASYQAQFGGNMSRMAVDPTGRLDPAAQSELNMGKVAEMRPRLRAMSQLMGILGSNDLDECLRAFRKLEGVEFGRVNPQAVLHKINTASSLATMTGQSPIAVYAGMSQTSEMIRQDTGAGVDPVTGIRSGYERAPGAGRLGEAEIVEARVAGAAARRGLTGNTEAVQELRELEQRRSARTHASQGGHLIDIATRMYMASAVSAPEFEKFRGAIESGNTRGAFRALNPMARRIAGESMGSDQAFNAYAEYFNFKMIEGLSPEQREARLAGTGQRVEDLQGRARESEVRGIGQRIGGNAAMANARAEARQYGIKYTPQQLAAQKARALDWLKGDIAKLNIDEEKRKGMYSFLEMEKESGKSYEQIKHDFRQQYRGEIGDTMAGRLNVLAAQSMDVDTVNDQKFVKGKTIVDDAELIRGVARITAKGKTPGVKVKNVKEAEEKLKAIMADKTSTAAQKEQARLLLDEYRRPPAESAERRREKVILDAVKEPATAAPGITRVTGETRTERQAVGADDSRNWSAASGAAPPGALETPRTVPPETKVEALKDDQQKKADDNRKDAPGGKKEDVVKVTGSVTLEGADKLTLNLKAPRKSFEMVA